MEDFKKGLEKFYPFLEDLRSRLYRGVILFVVSFAIGFFLAGAILRRILELVQLEEVTIAASSPLEFIQVAVNLGLFIAIIVCTPYIIYSFYAFIVPALTSDEKKKLVISIPFSVALFVFGFFYGIFILYYALELLAAVNIRLGIANFWNISYFLSQIFITSALLGLLFQLPVVLTLLIKLGIITPQTLRNYRRVAFFLMSSLSALLTPPDILSLLAMWLPMVLLYQGTILVNEMWVHDEK